MSAALLDTVRCLTKPTILVFDGCVCQRLLVSSFNHLKTKARCLIVYVCMYACVFVCLSAVALLLASMAC